MWKFACILSVIWAVSNTAPVENNNNLQVLNDLTAQIKEMVEKVKTQPKCRKSELTMEPVPKNETSKSEENTARKLYISSANKRRSTTTRRSHYGHPFMGPSYYDHTFWPAMGTTTRRPSTTAAPTTSTLAPTTSTLASTTTTVPTTSTVAPTTTTLATTSTTIAPTSTPCDDATKLMAKLISDVNLVVARTVKLLQAAATAVDPVAATTALANGIRDINTTIIGASANLALLFGISIADAGKFTTGTTAPALACIAPLSPLITAQIKAAVDGLNAYGNTIITLIKGL